MRKKSKKILVKILALTISALFLFPSYSRAETVRPAEIGVYTGKQDAEYEKSTAGFLQALKDIADSGEFHYEGWSGGLGYMTTAVDCGGYVSRALAACGILPADGTTYFQGNPGLDDGWTGNGSYADYGFIKNKLTDISQLEPGDIVFHKKEGVGISHVEVFLEQQEDGTCLVASNATYGEPVGADVILNGGFFYRYADLTQYYIDDSNAGFTYTGEKWDGVGDIVVRNIHTNKEFSGNTAGGNIKIDIPDDLGTYYSITGYGAGMWTSMGAAIAPGSKQAEVNQQWIAAGSEYTNHIATLNGKYLIATTTKFGDVGDEIQFVCKNGYVLNCIIADSKGTPEEAAATGGNEWGHDGGKNVVEFEVDYDYYLSHGNPGTDAWFPEIAGGVGSAYVGGNSEVSFNAETEGDTVNAGTFTLTMTAEGYYGEISKEIEIKPKNIDEITDVAISGSGRDPKVVLGGTLESGRDFEITDINYDANTITAAVNGLSQNYTGEKVIHCEEYEYHLERTDLKDNKDNVTITKADIPFVDYRPYYEYTGEKIEPKLTIKYEAEKLKKDVDYTIAYKNNTDIGTGKIIIKGIGKYKGKIAIPFSITRFSKISVQNADEIYYTGEKLTPVITVSKKAGREQITLKKGKDFAVSYRNNTETGIATAIITGKGIYEGSNAQINFRIQKGNIADAGAEIADQAWTGEDVTPKISFSSKLEKGKDYKVEFKNNADYGTAVAIIKGKGNWTGKTRVEFSIIKNIKKMTYAIPAIKYEGEPIDITDEVKIYDGNKTLKKDIDYTISVPEITKKGKYKITVEGMGEYAGKMTYKIKVK